MNYSIKYINKNLLMKVNPNRWKNPSTASEKSHSKAFLTASKLLLKILLPLGYIFFL